MKNCSWYLWLNGRKIFNIRQLRENFDTPLLTGYFLGGSLLKWLSDLGEYAVLKRLSTIDTSRDIGTQLEFAFGVSPDRKHALEAPAPELTIPADNKEVSGAPVFAASSFGSVSSFPGLPEGSFSALAESSFTALTESSFAAFMSAVGSFASAVSSSGSFTALYESSFAYIVGNAFAAKFTSSFNMSSYSFGSYAALVSGQALNIASSAQFGSMSSFMTLFGQNMYGFGGSFSLSSFSFGSFSHFFGKYGQFTLGSFGGSLTGSYAAWLSRLFALTRGGSFGSFGSFGNIGMFFGEGSFRYSDNGAVITAEEYHRTLINLSSCPLNAYGYGIDLI